MDISVEIYCNFNRELEKVAVVMEESSNTTSCIIQRTEEWAELEEVSYSYKFGSSEKIKILVAANAVFIFDSQLATHSVGSITIALVWIGPWKQFLPEIRNLRINLRIAGRSVEFTSKPKLSGVPNVKVS